ncbi:hypothetical protein HD554DRAFT_2168957 [Boletus coccyginus]|nr:hypothetical protein HD554DRAFT_2168957 [Boletus coccyginus]
MSLSLKAELETWAAALKAYDEQDFEKALDLFSRIADSSKILTNMGLIYATIGEHEIAVEHFVAATNLDAYLAIAAVTDSHMHVGPRVHFQCGVSNFLLQRYDLALLNFEDAYLYLRGNEAINYDQIGLKFKLFSAEILFNKSLTQINLGYEEAGMVDMREASRIKVTDEHSVIDEAMRDRGEGYTVFSIPVGVLYHPSQNKLKNSKSKDYLGKAKLVAASDSNDAFTEFTGVMRLQQASGGNVENNPEVELSPLSRSATVPTPRTDPVAAPPTAPERSKTVPQLRAGVRPDPATILASRRTQSVSSPANAPSPPFGSDLSKGNTALGRSNSSRLARTQATNAPKKSEPTPTGVAPLRVKTSTAGGVAGGETEAVTGGAPPTTLRSRPRLQGQASPVAQQSAPQPPPKTVQPGRYVNANQGVTPLVLPAAPAPAKGGRLTQFYDTYMDAYTDDHTSQSVIPRPPAAQGQSSASSSQRQSPATWSFYQPQPQPQEQQQLSAWVQSASSPVKTSSNTSTSSGMSRAPSRAASAGVGMNMEPITSMGTSTKMVKGGFNNAGRGSPRRKVTRRPTTRRAMACDDEDDGFVTGECDEFEMANIRVKLHYQGDVRGMTIPPTTSFNDFVERVTTKFGTSLTGLSMKFMDEEGTKISLRDESDFELAVETAREGAKGRSEGKIEVWCIDV